MRAFLTTILIAAAATPAMAGAPLLSASLETPRAERLITNGAAWACTDAGCLTKSSDSRPAILCERLVKVAGPVKAFAVNGAAFDAAQLEKCNRKAR